VERCFGTLQDRLVKGLRVAGARTGEEANAYLEAEFLPEWEKRFTVEARNPADAHRRLGREHDLVAILSQVVTNDYTLRFQGQSYRVAREGIRAGLRGSRVRVERRLDGTLAVRFRGRYLPLAVCQSKPEGLPIPRPVAVPAKARAELKDKQPSPWRKEFDLGRSRPLWAVLRAERGPRPTPREGW
jgi:hypothetical protein